MRIKFINFAVIFIFLFLFLNLLNLGIIKGVHFRELSDKNSIRLLPQEGSRGRILDRENNVLVDSHLTYDVMILPQAGEDSSKILKSVSGILGISLLDLKSAFHDNYAASFTPVKVAENIEITKAIALEELKSDFNGIIIQPHPQRTYPYGRLACHLLGYLNEIDRWRLTKLEDYGYKTKDIVGFGGIEEKYDYYLRQEEGGMSIEVDHRGRLVRVLGFRPPQSGKDIQLTIDLKIQKIAEELLGDKIGSVVLMEPYTGEIIAMANSPGFDPSLFIIKKTNPSMRSLFSNPDGPFINRAIGGAYPAGSVFKLIVAGAALEAGKINSRTSFFCSGGIDIGNKKFACWNTHGEQNLIAAITHSCNVFFYRTGLLAGAQSIHDYALKFGLGKYTSVDLPYEVSGFVPSPLWKRVYRFKSWFDGDTVNLAIGQGDLLVTPLQIARMTAVFANGGTLVRPYIVQKIGGKDISFYQRKRAVVQIKSGFIDYINQGLRNVVFSSSGTASALSALPVAVAGKTGTAQAGKGQPHAWFTGFFPYQKPKFVICVFLERGGSGYMASVLAKQIIERMSQGGLI